MGDAFFVGGVEGVGHLAGVVEDGIEGQRAFGAVAFDVLHDEVARNGGRGPDVEEGADVGMVQRGDGLGHQLAEQDVAIVRHGPDSP